MNVSEPMNTTGAEQDLIGLTSELPDWFTTAMRVPRNEGFIDVDGCAVHYFEWGDPNKPGLVMTHGFLAHARCFAFIAPLLAKEFHVAAFDMSGMGDSGIRAEYDANIRSQEMRAVAKTVGMFDQDRKPFALAHSYGGSTALTAVEQTPDDFAGVIVADMMMLRPEAAEAFMENRPGRLSDGRGKSNKIYPTYEEAMSRFRLAPEQPCENDYLFEYMGKHSLKAVDGGWSWKFHPSIMSNDNRSPDWWIEHPHRFARITKPKAIIHGEKSLLFTADSRDYVLELCEKPVPIISIPDAHHHLMLDQPIAFATAIKTILLSWLSR